MADFKTYKYSHSNSQNHDGRWHKIMRSPLACLIAVNIVVFLILGLLNILGEKNAVYYLIMSAPVSEWLRQPWGIISYMFTQTDVLHLIFNMLWLWAFGAVISRTDGSRTLIPTYLASGLIGAVCFLLTIIFIGAPFSYLIGSSSAVLGVIAGAAALHPRLRLNLMLFGSVELRWIALIALLICGIAPGIDNKPTLAAHIGGAIGGWLFVKLFYNRPQIFPSFKRKKMRHAQINVRSQERRGLNAAEQAELDRLLERVKRSGYKCLKMSERSRLFELSNKINKR